VLPKSSVCIIRSAVASLPSSRMSDLVVSFDQTFRFDGIVCKFLQANVANEEPTEILSRVLPMSPGQRKIA
jgi:hypothetical protein